MKNEKQTQKFKFLEHTADIKFQAFGNSVEEVFGNSGLAMFNSMSDEKVKERKSFSINVKGKDYESLLYNFLEELLFLFESENFFVGRIENLRIGKNFELSAEVFGDDADKHEIHIDIKAVTYNEMFVREENGKWVAQVVLDV